MSELAIETIGLSKHFGSQNAVINLSISVPAGAVAGFVGPNGAGKTTTIRMLLGLIRPTAGNAMVLGKSIDHPHAFLPKVGALIESPAFYPTLSGRANLKLLARLGGYSGTHIPDLISLVGLVGRDKDRFSTYSLGMKQRLGVAAALLPNPELLILDEPSNGLDPEGIIEMRDLLRRLRDQGKTVFVSSHLLSEVEQVADWIIVLKQGQSIFSGSTSALLKGSKENIVIAPEKESQFDELEALVKQAGYSASRQNGNRLSVAAPVKAGDLNRLAMDGGITLAEITRNQATLEETFLELIGGKSDV